MALFNGHDHRLTVYITDSNELVVGLSRQAAHDLGWQDIQDVQVTVVGLDGPPAQRALVLHTSRNLHLAMLRNKATMKKHA